MKPAIPPERTALHIIAVMLLVFFSHTGRISAQERFRRIPPSPDPLTKWSLPPIQSTSLPNGLSLLTLHKSGIPKIILKLTVKTGESSSPDNMPGLGTFTAKMLIRGTSSLSAQKIEETVASVGGQLSVEVFPERTIFTFTFLSEHLKNGLRFLSRFFIDPSFNQREIDFTKTALYYELAGKRFDKDFISRRVLMGQLFKNHPYGKYTFNEDSIKTYNREEIVKFFDTFYRPNNSQLLVVGEFDPELVEQNVRLYFSAWTRGGFHFAPEIPPAAQDKIKVCLVDFPQSRDATILVGNIMQPFSPGDYFPYSVFNTVLGGTPNSRIFLNLRESKGYSYEAFSSVEFFRDFGIFTVKARVRSGVILQSIREILRELNQIVKQRIPVPELEQAKSYLIGSFPLEIETPEKLASKLSEILVLNMEESAWGKYAENIMRINSDQVNSLVRNSSLSTPVIVIVAPQGEIIDALTEQFDEVEIYNYKGILRYAMKRFPEETLDETH